MKLVIKEYRLVFALLFTISLLIPSVIAVNENIDTDVQQPCTLIETINTRNIGQPTPISTYWAKSYVLDAQTVMGSAIMETNDGNYIIAGDLVDMPKRNIFLMEIDTSGNVNWFRVYDIGASPTYDGGSEGVTSIDEVVLTTGDHGYVITGYTDLYKSSITPPQESLPPPGDIFVMQVNSVGDPIWLKAYINLNHPDNYQYGKEIRTCNIDGDIRFIVIGTTHTPTYSDYDFVALLLDINGDVVRYVQFDSNVDDFAPSVAIHTDPAALTSFGICGSRRTGSYGMIDPFFLLLNDDLDIVIAREYGIINQGGDSNDDSLSCIRSTSNGEFIMCGTSESHPGSKLKSVLIIRATPKGKPLWMRTFNEMPPNGLDNVGIAIDELPSVPAHFVLTCIRGAEPDYDLGIMGTNKSLNLLWARFLQAGKPNFPCNTYLLGAEIMHDLYAIDDGFLVTGYSNSAEAVPDTAFFGGVVCKFDEDGYIRKNPSPCCTETYSLDSYVHDEYENLTFERSLVQYDVPDWTPTEYDDMPKTQKICTPGFESILLFSAIAVLVYLIQKRKKNLN
jgi:hypothetical protein